MVTQGQRHTFVLAAAGLALLLSAGCATRPPCTNGAFAKNPLAYRRVQVLPVLVTPVAHPDKTLATNTVWQINCSVATNLADSLCRSLQAHGFEVLGQHTILACSNDWAQLGEPCAKNIAAAHYEFAQTSRAIWWRLEKEKAKLVDYHLTNATAFACADEVASNVNAIVLMRSTVFVESRQKRNQRRGEMALVNTLGILAAFGGMGFWYSHPSPSGVENTVAIVDSRTMKILWWNSSRVANLSLSDTNAVAYTVRGLINQLPAPPRQSESH
jgi:hypothetical protein